MHIFINEMSVKKIGNHSPGSVTKGKRNIHVSLPFLHSVYVKNYHASETHLVGQKMTINMKACSLMKE